MFNDLCKLIFKDISNYLKFNINIINNNKSNSNDNNLNKIIEDCDNSFITHIQTNKNIIGYISKRTQKLIYFNDNDNDNNIKYIIAFSSLEGVINYESNLNCGSIYGIYSFDTTNNKIINIVDSGYTIYGINNIMIYTENNNVKINILNGWNNFVSVKILNSKDSSSQENKLKIYSINNKHNDKEIEFLIRQYKINNYKLRYSGSLVVDTHNILLNSGIFYYPDGKINLIYQALPLAYIFKLCGGTCLNESYIDILDNTHLIDINNIKHTSSIIFLSQNEKYNFMELLKLYETYKY